MLSYRQDPVKAVSSWCVHCQNPLYSSSAMMEGRGFVFSLLGYHERQHTRFKAFWEVAWANMGRKWLKAAFSHLFEHPKWSRNNK